MFPFVFPEGLEAVLLETDAELEAVLFTFAEEDFFDRTAAPLTLVTDLGVEGFLYEAVLLLT